MKQNVHNIDWLMEKELCLLAQKERCKSKNVIISIEPAEWKLCFDVTGKAFSNETYLASPDKSKCYLKYGRLLVHTANS